MSKDYLVRGIGPDGGFRVVAATTTVLAEQARRRHDTWPVATAALGRALTAGLMLGSNLKGEDMLTLRIFGNGPLGAIIVSADSSGGVRGYVQEPHVHVTAGDEGKLPVGAAVGKEGYLHVTREIGLREPFTGSVELVTGEIGQDMARYLAVSEQTPSAVALGVLVAGDCRVQASGGLMVQLLPGADDKTLARLEKAIEELGPVSSLVNRGMSPEEIVAAGTGGMPFEILGKTPVYFRCKCSREKIMDTLAALGKKDLESILEGEKEALEVCCHFCNEKYYLHTNDLIGLLLEDL